MTWTHQLAAHLGIESGILATCMVLLGNILLAPLYGHLKHPVACHIMSIAVTSLTYSILFGFAGFVQLTALALVCYAIMATVRCAYTSPILVGTVSMAVLCLQLSPIDANEIRKCLCCQC
ncbi:Lysophospholipid acyltransferase [Batrachochytrium dendrobatidis]